MSKYLNHYGNLVAEEGFEPPTPAANVGRTASRRAAATLLQLLAVMILALPAAASSPWDTADKVLFGSSILTAAADVITTNQAIKNGAYEVNPLYGDNPSLWKLIGVKAGFLVTRYFLADWLDPGWRKGFLGMSICMEAYATGNNIKVAGEARW